MTKVAIICCQKAQDIRSVSKDLLAAQEGTGSFTGAGPQEIIGCIFCGGCTGKRVVKRAKMLERNGADIIALSSQLKQENGGICPHYTKIRIDLTRRLPSVVVLDGTY